MNISAEQLMVVQIINRINKHSMHPLLVIVIALLCVAVRGLLDQIQLLSKMTSCWFCSLLDGQAFQLAKP